jgi:eukaryotic-like serine/threonine-protein kinase
MNPRAPSATASESRLVKVLDDYLAALHRGDPLNKSELLAANADMAEDLEACLASLDFIRDAAASGLVQVPSGETSIGTPATGLLGDFRIIREAGRGGMGVVYEAEQVSLCRRVALKVLPFAATLDPRQLARFRVEAQAAAQLHHTNIVPVFSVGVERGVHYYAMQFIEGQSLAEVIHERRQDGDLGCRDSALLDGTPWAGSSGVLTSGPPYFQAVARLGVQAAEALEYAHSFGILHRDIKPANLLLDIRGTLWVTDFGLARLHDDAGLTMTGDVLGTLRYMSPEQALARRVLIDERTDVYSLGLTLYELLILRPAYDGHDRQELLRQIAFEEPPAPRRIVPAIPRELETVILKAMTKEPEGRYASAQELADDLRRFLEYKPIRAKRPTLKERASKWLRRHPAIPISGFLLLITTVIGLAIGSTLLARKQVEVTRQRDRANTLAGVASDQQTLAERNARLARRTVDEMFTQVAEKWLADEPRLEPVQREFLEKALRCYEELSSQSALDSAGQEAIADALERVGDIRLRLGMIRPAEDAFRQALAIDRSLADASPADRELRYRTISPHLDLGRVLLADGKPQDAAEEYTRAERIARTLTDGTSGSRRDRAALADALAGLGLTATRLGNHLDAQRALDQGISIEQKLLDAGSQDHKLRSVLANNLHNLATNHGQAGNLKEAESACRRARDLRQQLLDQSPASKECRDELAMSVANLGLIRYLLKDVVEAEALYRSALVIRRKLADDSPGVPDFRKRLAEDLDNLAAILRNSNRPLEAEPLRREAVGVLESLVRDYPDLPEIRESLGNRLSNLGVLLKGLDKEAEAEESFRRAMETLESQFVAHPEIPSSSVRFLECATVRGDILTRLGRGPEAEAVYRRTHDLSLKSADRLPKAGGFTEVNIRFLVGFAGFLRNPLRRDVEAREIYLEALIGAELLLKGNPRGGQERELWTWAASCLSKLLSTSADPNVRDADKAVELAARGRDLRPEFGDAWNALGEAHFRARHWDDAIPALKKAGELRSDENVTGWYYLAMAYWQKGNREQALRWYREAARWMEKNPPKNEEFVRLRDEAEAMLGLASRSKPVGDNRGGNTRPTKP